MHFSLRSSCSSLVLLAAGSACPLVALAAEPSGPSYFRDRLSSLTLSSKAFSSEERTALAKVPMFHDRTDPNTVYIVLPLQLNNPGSRSAWSERRFANFDAANMLYEAVWLLTSKSKGALTNLIRPQDGKSGVKADNSPTETGTALAEALNGSNQAIQEQFIELVKNAFTLSGMPFPPMADMDAARKQAALLIDQVVAEIQLPLGFGMDPIIGAAFNKVLDANPNLRIVELPGNGAYWNIVSDGAGRVSARDRSEDTANGSTGLTDTLTGFLNKLSRDIEMFQGVDKQQISSAGGTLKLKVAYPVARSLGFSGMSRDPFENPAIDQWLPGNVEQVIQVPVGIGGKLECKFNAEVSGGYIYSIQKSPSDERPMGFVLTDKSRPTEGKQEITYFDCTLYDMAGNVLSDKEGNVNPDALADIPPSERSQVVNKLGNLIASRVRQLEAQYMERYYATVSLKNEILATARANANNFSYMPLPQEPRLVNEWSSSQSCSPVPTTQYCSEVTTEYFGPFEVDEYCSRYDWNYENQCKSYWEQIQYYVNVPVEAHYMDRVDFERAINATDVFNFNANSTYDFVLNSSNNVCFSRVVSATDPDGNPTSFARTPCSVADGMRAENKAATDVANTAIKPVVNNPEATEPKTTNNTVSPCRYDVAAGKLVCNQ